MIYDLAIIGGGPAGNAAGVYAARKQLKTIFLTTEFGGQSIVSPEIYNWIGEQKISGEDLAKKLVKDVQEGIEKEITNNAAAGKNLIDAIYSIDIDAFIYNITRNTVISKELFKSINVYHQELKELSLVVAALHISIVVIKCFVR
jgi:thioredoxin reductase